MMHTTATIAPGTTAKVTTSCDAAVKNDPGAPAEKLIDVDAWVRSDHATERFEATYWPEHAEWDPPLPDWTSTGDGDKVLRLLGRGSWDDPGAIAAGDRVLDAVVAMMREAVS